MRLFPALGLLIAVSSLAACGLVDRIRGDQSGFNDPGVEAEVVAVPLSAAPLQGAQSAAALDQSSAADKAAATAAPAAGQDRSLGSVVVALGSPAEQGFWLRSGLVTAAVKGRVVTASGQTVNVDLQPGEGAALMSLAAYRALGLGLTDLPEVQVYAN